jgi:hypothetical protein
MRRGLVLIVALQCAALLAACPEPELRTQVMALVAADAQVRARAHTLRVQVYGRSPDKSSWDDAAFDEHIEPLPAFPYRVAVVPRGGRNDRQFRVVVVAEGEGGYQVRAQSIGNFQAGQTLAVDVFLDDRCDRVHCDEASETCRAGACEDALVTRDDLRPYHPESPGYPAPDGGAWAESDGASEARDAGRAGGDAAVPSDDASFHECERSKTQCSDGVRVTCSASGTIDGEEVCTFGCAQAGSRCNLCEPSQSVCEAGKLTVCGSDGTPRSSSDCPVGCHADGDRCIVPDCEPSTTRCVQNQEVVCSATGQIESDQPCMHGCGASETRCHACTPGTVLCEDDRLITCDDDGVVSDDTLCLLGCSAGRCLDIDPSNQLAAQLDLIDITHPTPTPARCAMAMASWWPCPASS